MVQGEHRRCFTKHQLLGCANTDHPLAVPVAWSKRFARLDIVQIDNHLVVKD
jgi:hypothetical protein